MKMTRVCFRVFLVNLFLALYLPFSRADIPDTARVAMERYGGTPREFGIRFGERHSEILRQGQSRWLAAKGISREEILDMAKPMVEVLREIAPHWLEETEGIAEAAGIDAALAVAQLLIINTQDDCTTYLMTAAHNEADALFFHRTRDNRPGRQTGAIWDIDAPGINKFMAVTYTASRGISVMVNEKGLAASADMGGPPDHDPKNVGMMNGLMLRYIAEKASDSLEALEIVERFVKNGWYTRGRAPGTVWTFADRYGNVIRASHNSGADSLSSSRVETGFYSTRGGADLLAALDKPVSFTTFRNVSRDPKARIDRGRASIAGMTVKIHPEYPEFLTTAWFSFPAVGLAFPMYMGGVRTPLPLLDGSVYEIGADLPNDFETWEKIERDLLVKAAELEAQVEEMMQRDRVAEARQLIDEWTREITEKHLRLIIDE